MSYNFYGGENFTRIQGAIENASAGDVLVYNGTYFENVVIYKRFTCIDLNKILTEVSYGRTISRTANLYSKRRQSENKRKRSAA
jgi:hypothetical protein